MNDFKILRDYGVPLRLCLVFTKLRKVGHKSASYKRSI